MDRAKELREARTLIVDDEPAHVLLLELTPRKAGYSAIRSTTDPRRAEVRPEVQFGSCPPILYSIDMILHFR